LRDQAINEKVKQGGRKPKHGMPLKTRTFGDIANLAIAEMRKALAEKRGKSIYNDYIIALNRYLIPFLGSHLINRIDFAAISSYEDWRAEKMGKRPTASSVGTHNSAINKVFDEAIKRGYVAAEKRPFLVNEGVDGKRRPDFTLDEYVKMVRGLRQFVANSRDGKTREMRLLLRDYVLILANSGIRHGTEADNLCWRHIRLARERGREVLLFYVDGKTGGREIVARSNCLAFLRRIQSRNAELSGMSLRELLESRSDQPVFTLSDGTRTDNLRGTFRIFLKQYGMLKDPRTGQNRTLYSLRHTYATFALTYKRGVDIHLLATQMGTSTLMIERHYSHLIARLRSATLAGGRW
jgi:integrase